jgi:hypothetical protein
MAHPNIIKHVKGKIWHLEDTVTTKIAAESLVTHLIKTEEKNAHYKKTKDGYQVWWSK